MERSVFFMLKKVRVLCRTAIMVAMYVLLNMVAIKAGNLHITFASLPVVTTALLFGPGQAALVGLCGEFINQMLGYGFTATTPIWILPPAIRGILIGAAALAFAKTGKSLDKRPIACYAVCVIAAVITTFCNTVGIWIDSVIYGYYTFAYVFGDALIRFITGMVAAVVIATVAIPLIHLLRRSGMVQDSRW